MYVRSLKPRAMLVNVRSAIEVMRNENNARSGEIGDYSSCVRSLYSYLLNRLGHSINTKSVMYATTKTTRNIENRSRRPHSSLFAYVFKRSVHSLRNNINEICILLAHRPDFDHSRPRTQTFNFRTLPDNSQFARTLPNSGSRVCYYILFFCVLLDNLAL